MKRGILIVLLSAVIGMTVGCGANGTTTVSDQSGAVAAEKNAGKGEAATAADKKQADKESSPEVVPEDDSTFSELEPVDTEAEKTGIITDESEKAEIMEELEKGSLDVENDTFEFENMTSFIGKPESELIALIGAEGHPEGFATKLFGEDVSITTAVDGESVTEIKLVFPSTDKELLVNALGEQLGTDPEESEGVLSWTYLGKVIRLQDVEEGIQVTVSAEE